MVEPSSAFHAWVASYFKSLNQPVPQLQAIQGDAGFRRYFRLQSDIEFLPILAVNAPPQQEDSRAFISVCDILRAGGVPAPEILASDLSHGFLLVEDLGHELLLDKLNEESVDGLYQQGMHTLLKIQQCRMNSGELPSYDQQKLLQEMQLFDQWFVPQLLDYQMNESEEKLVSDAYAILLDSALQQPTALVHRDYHSRNLILRDESLLGVIDFQDAVIGPLTYDLVSLLRDCYIHWPQNQVEAWALKYKKMLQDKLILQKEISDQQFIRWFDLMGLQRHIKVLGIFARLYLRDGKQRYLHDLPLVIAYTREIAAKYEELTEFAAWFDKVLMPLAQTQTQTQSWYKKVELIS